jgi:hypothetical protein
MTLMFSGCVDMYEPSLSNPRIAKNAHGELSINYGSQGSSKMRIIKEYKINGQNCREFDNHLKSYGGEIKYISVTCQKNDGSWYILEKKDPYYAKKY